MGAADFVALADVLRAPAAPVVPPAPQPDAPVEPAAPVVPLDVIDALRDARVFRARLADALQDAFGRLLRDVASDVLARELRLAPCDLEGVLRSIAERGPIVRVRVAPEDVWRVAGFAVVADAGLASGDAVVELAGGAIDARLGVRLAVVLEAFA